jgi:hypothetical protein
MIVASLVTYASFCPVTVDTSMKPQANQGSKLCAETGLLSLTWLCELCDWQRRAHRSGAYIAGKLLSTRRIASTSPLLTVLFHEAFLRRFVVISFSCLERNRLSEFTFSPALRHSCQDLPTVERYLSFESHLNTNPVRLWIPRS